MGQRQCTYDFKIRPLQRFCKPHASKGNPVISQIGISTDEWTRMKPSRVKYMENTWPLIDLEMSRNDCMDWLKDKGWGNGNAGTFHTKLENVKGKQGPNVKGDPGQIWPPRLPGKPALFDQLANKRGQWS